MLLKSFEQLNIIGKRLKMFLGKVGKHWQQLGSIETNAIGGKLGQMETLENV